MPRIFDDHLSRPTPEVTRHFDVDVDHAHDAVGRNNGQRLAHQCVRHRVVVAVEAHERGLVDDGAADVVGRRHARRQRQQPRLLFGEAILDGAPDDGRMFALHGDVGTEAKQSRVAVFDGRWCPPRQRAIAHVPDRALDFSFLLRLAWRAQFRLHVERSRRRQQQRMEANDVGATAILRSMTMVFGLSNSHVRVTPPKASPARTSERATVAASIEKHISAHEARDHDSTMTNIHIARFVPSTST